MTRNWNFCVARGDPTSILYNLTMADVSLFSQRSISSLLLPLIWPEQKRKKEIVISFMTEDVLVSTNDLINLCGVPSSYGNYVTMDWTLSLSQLLSQKEPLMFWIYSGANSCKYLYCMVSGFVGKDEDMYTMEERPERTWHGGSRSPKRWSGKSSSMLTPLCWNRSLHKT